MNKKRLIAILLLAGIAASALTGCGEGTTDTQVTTGGQDDTTTVSEDSPYDAKGFLNDDLPSDLNFNGKTVSIYVRGDTLNQYDAEQSADIVDDAIYERNRKIEERLGVKLNIFTNTSDDFWGDRDLYMDTVRGCVLSNDGSIDIAAGLSNIMPVLVQDGMFHNLLSSDIKYLDFDKPWWPDKVVSEMSIKNKMHIVSGDADLGVIKYMCGIFFNKDMIADFQLEDPYELVLSGKWTLDKLAEMSSGIYSDLNSDGTRDAGDRYGFIMGNDNHAPLFVLSSGMNFTKRGNDGIPVYDLGTEKVFNLFDKIVTMMGREDSITNNAQAPGISCPNTFSDGNALFTTGEFCYAETYRDVKFDYGILPFPKYDENQSNYYGGVRATYSMLGIPVTADTNAATAVLEALASENYRSVVPAYFESALKVKYARDDTSSQMFDIIKSGVDFDLGIVLGPMMGAAITTNVRSELSFAQGQWASTWAERKDLANTDLRAYVDAVLALED